MDMQHCLGCGLSKTKYDHLGVRCCFCFYNPKRGKRVDEIEVCPMEKKVRIRDYSHNFDCTFTDKCLYRKDGKCTGGVRINKDCLEEH